MTKRTARPLGGRFELIGPVGLLTIVLAQAAAADSEFPELTVHGLLDLRYQHSDAAPGELEHGLGKLRAGGERDRWRVNEAAATLQVRLDWDWMVNATVKYADRQSAPSGPALTP